MKALLPISAALFCALTASANATNGTTGAMLEPTVINASYDTGISTTSMMPVQSTRQIYEHAFYTPQPNFEQAGYSCSPTVSVSYSGHMKHMHRGTYCIR